MLDDRVGGEVEVEVERAFETVVVKLQVQDLHSITPSMFFQVLISYFLLLFFFFLLIITFQFSFFFLFFF